MSGRVARWKAWRTEGTSLWIVLRDDACFAGATTVLNCTTRIIAVGDVSESQKM